MKIKDRKVSLLVLPLVLSFVSGVSSLQLTNVEAQERSAKSKKEDKKEKPLPKRGMLAISGDVGFGEHNFPGAWGEKHDGGGSSAPISGSVSRSGPKEWVARLENTSEEDQYTVTARVIQTNRRGDSVRSDSFSATLKPGAKSERTYASHAQAVSGMLELVGWKKKSLAKPKATDEEGAGEKSDAASNTASDSSAGAIPERSRQ